MRKIVLRFRADDKDFKKIRDKLKTVETRAATKLYRNIAKDDILVIVCGKERITRKVKRARHFRSITSMTKAIPFRRIMPSVPSIAAMRRAYYRYPGYKEKLKRFGVVAWEI